MDCQVTSQYHIVSLIGVFMLIESVIPSQIKPGYFPESSGKKAPQQLNKRWAEIPGVVFSPLAPSINGLSV